MHLKDYSGGEHFVGYCPLGQGKVDLETDPAADERRPSRRERDGGTGRLAGAPYTPRETAEISKTFLLAQGYRFRV